MHHLSFTYPTVQNNFEEFSEEYFSCLLIYVTLSIFDFNHLRYLWKVVESNINSNWVLYFKDYASKINTFQLSRIFGYFHSFSSHALTGSDIRSSFSSFTHRPCFPFFNRSRSSWITFEHFLMFPTFFQHFFFFFQHEKICTKSKDKKRIRCFPKKTTENYVIKNESIKN